MNKIEREKMREVASQYLGEPGGTAEKTIALLDQIDALEANNKELVRTLKPFLERSRYINDCCPSIGSIDEGWQSTALEDEIKAADAAIANASEEL